MVKFSLFDFSLVKVDVTKRKEKKKKHDDMLTCGATDNEKLDFGHYYCVFKMFVHEKYDKREVGMVHKYLNVFWVVAKEYKVSENIDLFFLSRYKRNFKLV